MGIATSKLGRYAFGLAASGGMALLFAGTASAASLSPVVPPNDTTQISQGSSTTVVDSVSTTTTTTIGSVVGVVTTTDNGDGDSGASTPKTTLTEKNVSGDSQAVVPTANTAPTASVDVTDASVTVATTPSVDAVTATPVIISSAIMHQSELTTVTMPQTPVTLALADPSTSSTSKQPAMPKTNGALFSNITDQLAGTIVPRLIATLSSALAPTIPVSGVLIYIAILLSLVSITYGQIIRRGGFVAAARGDLNNLTFATPVDMDYGVMRMPMVLFNGVRYQNMTNLIRSNACEERR